MDAVGDYLADQLGIPAELRTTPQERQQIQQELLQAAQAQLQAQGMAQPEQAIEQ
jgi:hypothetical protein